MGAATNIIILMIVISFALYMFTPEHESTLFYSMIDGDFIYEDIGGQIAIIVGLSALSVAVGLFSGSGMAYSLFAGIITLLLTFVSLPTDVLLSTTLPIEIRVLLISVFGVMYIMAVLSFYKGTGEI